MHRLAHTLALAIYPAKNADDVDLLCETIESTTTGYSDERKADLYARIAEGVDPDMTFEQMTGAIDTALKANDRTFHLA